MTTVQRVQAAVMAVAPHRIVYSPRLKTAHIFARIRCTVCWYSTIVFVDSASVQYLCLHRTFPLHSLRVSVCERRHTLTLSLYCSAPPPSTASDTPSSFLASAVCAWCSQRALIPTCFVERRSPHLYKARESCALHWWLLPSSHRGMTQEPRSTPRNHSVVTAAAPWTLGASQVRRSPWTIYAALSVALHATHRESRRIDSHALVDAVGMVG